MSLPSNPTAIREQTADEQVAHVLSRLTFGARPGDVARVREMGVDAFIAQQLRPERIADPRLEAWLSQFETLDLTYSELQKAYPRPAEALQRLQAADRNSLSAKDSAELRRIAESVRRVTTEVQSARVGRALVTQRQLDEVMTDFWLNHFSVFQGKSVPMRYMLAEYENRVIRPRALGKFRDLLGAVAKSPAMLMYLDNWQSAADSGRPRTEMPRLQQAMRRGLNENYGRELLELHTLGVDGGYTQQDVVNVARALTGWTFLPQRPDDRQIEQMAAGARQPGRAGGRIRQRQVARAIERRLPEPGVFYFNPAVHDAGEKVVLGTRLRAGRGIEDGEDVLDLVARHPATARHIATKLARRFVSDDPPDALVERAAATFSRTDGDIREVVRTIVTSPEFFSHAAFRAKVKTPFEVVVSALRALDAAPDPTPRTAQVVGNLGQPIYGRQTPDGWPDVAGEWMGTGAILNRINFGLAVGANRLPGARATDWPGAAELREASRERQVDGVIAAFLGGRVSPETREILISGQNPLQARGASEGETPARLQGLAQLVGLAIGSPEFQRR
jgi:uncharacterized protein (DUF1800 family)